VLALLEYELAVRGLQVVFGDADAALQAYVDELGLQQLAAELFTVLTGLHAAAVRFRQQALDADAVLRGDAAEGFVHLALADHHLGLLRRALLELFVHHALDQRLVELRNGGVSLGADWDRRVDLSEVGRGAPT